jgi:hypothetical protein
VGGQDAVATMGDDSSDDEAVMASRTSTGRKKSSKVPFIQAILIEAAIAGSLRDGKKLEDIESDLVVHKNRFLFVNAMKLVGELWTEEEELFLRSSPDEINESLGELKVIADTIAVRCLTKLNEFEGRHDNTPTNAQKPSYVSIGARARKVFLSRVKQINDHEVAPQK